MDEDYSPTRKRRALKRQYVRKQTMNAPGIQAPTSPPQLSELAFNIHGWALEDGMTWRGIYEVINAHRATMIKGGFKEKIKELEVQGVTQVYRQDLRYTNRELDSNLINTDPSTAQYLVVGYTLQEDDPVFTDNKTFMRYSENELVGETRPSPDHIVPWSQVRTPILVVTPIKENTGTSVRLFGLIMPKSGLCQPVLLTHERIFYRWEFRASAGARYSQRNKNWNQIVIDKARELTPAHQLIKAELGDEEPDLDYMSARPYKKARRQSHQVVIKQDDSEEDASCLDAPDQTLPAPDIFEIALDLESLFEAQAERHKPVNMQDHTRKVMTRIQLALNDESRTVLLAIRTSQSSQSSAQVKGNLQKVSQAVGGYGRKPSLQNEGLAALTHPGARLSVDECVQAVNEIRVFWPELGDLVNADLLYRIKEMMNAGDARVTFESMKDFLTYVLTQNAINRGLDDLGLSIKTQEAIRVSQILQGGPGALLAVSDTGYMLSPEDTSSIDFDVVYLVVLLAQLAAVHQWQTYSTRLMFADVPSTFNKIEAEHYLNINDIWREAGELSNHLGALVAYAQTKDCGVHDILLWLERLRLRLRVRQV